MAEIIIVGALVTDDISRLSSLLIGVIQKSQHFRSQLNQLQETINRITPILKEIEKLNKVLGGRKEETDNFIRQLNEAEELLKKCEHIRYNVVKRVRQMYKLEALNKSILRFFQIDVALHGTRDAKEILLVARDVGEKMDRGGWLCHLPMLQDKAFGFEDRVGELKRLLLNDSRSDDGCSVVVITGGAGYGKTTLATLLCHDAEVQGIFGSNIYFATISNSPNLKGMIRNMLPFNPAFQETDFANDKKAIARWGSFLYTLQESPVLLLLDDVWSLSIIMDFRFKIRGYKILLAKCCRKLPLALIIIGNLLCGARVDEWRLMLNKLSQGPRAVLDLEMDNIWQSQLATCLGV
ncbi:NB-ARC domains-containing protein [Artemisia annua]|uniref:NB-ARC domains-containing protein n=1 Tax=Artemisia annua TaxID=35608 RepID=A0A2U1QPI4_ARTAN|nr:NB-ARC domains-containing protein [Artemisia annua]